MRRETIKRFYAQPHVRQRIAEYIGTEEEPPATCVYLAQPDLGWPRMDSIHRPEDTAPLLETDHDLSRSLWDRQSLIADLDIEYVNFDFPGEPYIHPTRSFHIQDPVRLESERILWQHGIDALHLVSGRGHHYVWRVPVGSDAFRRLQQLGRCNRTLINRYCHPNLPLPESVPPDSGFAYAGLGLIMEYLAQQIRNKAATTSAIPVHLTAVAVGPGDRGREMVSIDISEYADPLHLRVVRVPFTAYQKPALEEVYDTDNKALMTLAAPKASSIESVLAAMRDTGQASCLAERTSTRIPAATWGMERLITDYQQSSLCAFHDAFFSQMQHPPEQWEGTYDRLSMDSLPPCVAHILTYPNERLMRPAAIELVVRVLMALDWHPRHIAGLIRSKYERDYGWGDQWLVHDAATRADFYTRIFAGAFAVGSDDLVDFNCTSTREKVLCAQPRDGCGLHALRTLLLERR